MQDASELWNHDAIQTAELFQELRLGQTNCLADNRQVLRPSAQLYEQQLIALEDNKALLMQGVVKSALAHLLCQPVQ